MSKLVPLGARVMVKDDEARTDMQTIADRAGIALVTFEHNIPKPTTGIVVAIGSDPEVQRLIEIGDRVFFGRHCGITTVVEGEEYRTLEFHELTSILKPDKEETNEKRDNVERPSDFNPDRNTA